MLLRFPVLAVIVMLLAGSCTTVEPTTTSTPRTTTTTAPAFDPDAWARTYIVEFRSEGTFADDPLAGFATGLVVDEQGLIVVPATAVVGADRVNLTISGEEFPLEGSVEALAECSNLALVSVDCQFPSAARLADSVDTASWFVWTSDGLSETSPAGPFEPSPWMIAIDANGDVISIASNAVGEVDAGHTGEVVSAMRRRELVGELDFAGVDQPDGSVLVTGVRAGSPVATAGLPPGI
jgi:S1-C subfamily serine protease